jgi:PadR family transcriptional regulator PadR
VLKDFFLGFVKIHILYHASREPVYGVDLSVRKGVVDGKVRKYYTVTEQGMVILNEARKKIAELVDEVLLDR